MTDQMKPMNRKMPDQQADERRRAVLLRAEAEAGQEGHSGAPQEDQDQEEPAAVGAGDRLDPARVALRRHEGDAQDDRATISDGEQRSSRSNANGCRISCWKPAYRAITTTPVVSSATRIPRVARRCIVIERESSKGAGAQDVTGSVTAGSLAAAMISLLSSLHKEYAVTRSRVTRQALEMPSRPRHGLTREDTFVNQRDPARRLGPDGLPAVSRRAPLWADVPDEKWNDWRWQLSNRVNDLAEIEQILNLTDEEREGLSAPDKFRVDITPYFISLIDPDDPERPDPSPGHPARPRAAGVHGDDGGLARRGPPLPGARPRPSLSRIAC